MILGACCKGRRTSKLALRGRKRPDWIHTPLPCCDPHAPQRTSRPGIREMPESAVPLDPPSSRVFLRKWRTSGYRWQRSRELRQCDEKAGEDFRSPLALFHPLFSSILTAQIQIRHPPASLLRSKAMAGASSPIVMRSSAAVVAGVPSPSSPTSVLLDPLPVCVRKFKPWMW
jgi:hypothetical protein